MFTLKIVHLGTLELYLSADNTIPQLLAFAEGEGWWVPAYSTVANSVNLKGYYVTDFRQGEGQEYEDVPALFIIQPSLK